MDLVNKVSALSHVFIDDCEKILFLFYFVGSLVLSSETLEHLVESGLPNMIQDISPSSAHVHKDLDDVQCNVRDFGLIGANIRSCIQKPRGGSAFLSRKNGRETLQFSSEGDVESWVELYISDMVKMLDLGHQVEIRKGMEIIRLKPDLWLLTTNKIPFLAIEVKKPQPGILDDPKVIAQITQYMRLYRCFRGLCHVLGIVTTLTEWKIVWLPDCDEYARSTTLASPQNFEISEDAVVNNSVSGTQTITGSDPKVHHYISSVILKAFYGATRYQLHHLTIPKRLVACVNQSTLSWKRLKWQQNNKFCFSLPGKTTPLNFYLLEDMSHGAHGRLWIVTSPTSTSLYKVFVMKVFATEKVSTKRSHEMFEQNTATETGNKVFYAEASCWRALHFDFRQITICGSDALLLPYAITAKSSSEWNLSFLMNIRDFMDANLVEQIQVYLQQHFPRAVAINAIETVSNAGILHEDIKWEHVAVVPVPVFEQKKLVHYEFRSTFIDYGNSKFTHSEEARAEMISKLNRLP